ncbi:hypothetical protein MSAN_02011700 [Mycena sanguinolenta]|uniref:Uncharacterized protein n=1 Tax=Mycena sanguinolenta TaxID=230812 RepID=A0A8H6XKZ2_9AGAR|nr:hypothetical protein MSAN_02011700 [Mycena sanguinolenta]
MRIAATPRSSLQMVQFTRAFSLLAVLSVVLAASVKRDAATVEVDLKTTSSAVTDVYNAINTFSGSANIENAGRIEVSVNNLGGSLVTVTKDANASPSFSDADCTAIINEVEAFTSTIVKGLQKFATCAAQINQLHLQGLACGSLKDLKSKTEGAFTALKAKCVNQQTGVTTIENQILAAGDGVTSAFKC